MSDDRNLKFAVFTPNPHTYLNLDSYTNLHRSLDLTPKIILKNKKKVRSLLSPVQNVVYLYLDKSKFTWAEGMMMQYRNPDII
jgi:hypothetical protein